jgi:hypothetical protein
MSQQMQDKIIAHHQLRDRKCMRLCFELALARVQHFESIPHTDGFTHYENFDNFQVSARARSICTELHWWSPHHLTELNECPIGDTIERVLSTLCYAERVYHRNIAQSHSSRLSAYVDELSQLYTDAIGAPYHLAAVERFRADVDWWFHPDNNSDGFRGAERNWWRDADATTLRGLIAWRAQRPERVLMQLVLLHGMRCADTSIRLLATLMAHHFGARPTAALVYVCNALHYAGVGDACAWDSMTLADAIDAILTGDLAAIRRHYLEDTRTPNKEVDADAAAVAIAPKRIKTA